MVVRLLTAIAGPDYSHASGDLFDTDDATAARLVANGFAEPVSRVIEAAMRPVAKARGKS